MANSGYKRRFGDRKEGRLLRTLSPVDRLNPYLLKKRTEASGFYSDSLDISSAEDFISAKRAEGYDGMSMLHLFIASYVRTLASCPGLNRFVAGNKVYSRHAIEVVITVKRSPSPDVPVTVIKTELDPADTIFDVYRKISGSVEAIIADEGMSGTDGIADTLTRLPGPVLRFVIWIFRIMEHFGSLPLSLREISPYHGSLSVTDLGPLGMRPAYKGLSDFGNLPVNIILGEKRSIPVTDASGETRRQRLLGYSAAVDERICDFHCFAAGIRHMQHYMKNPRLLEHHPDKVTEDVF